MIGSLDVFQTLTSSKKIILSEIRPKMPACPIGAGQTSCNKENEVTFWHYRLGHSNFTYLEKIIYTRRRNNKREVEHSTCFINDQELKPPLIHNQHQTGKETFGLDTTPRMDDFNIPLALRSKNLHKLSHQQIHFL